MKMMLLIFALSSAHSIAVENPVPESPFVDTAELPPSRLTVSNIDLKAGQSLQDAVQQIVAGLSPEGRRFFVVDIPDAELGKLKLKENLRLRNAPLISLCKILEQRSPVGCSLRHGVWHICKERADDVIAVEYRMRKSDLIGLGISIQPNGMLLTKSGRMWPSGMPSGSGEWKATYTADERKAADQQNDTLWEQPEGGVLRVLATRSFHDEIEAELLLRSRGYDRLSFGG